MKSRMVQIELRVGTVVVKSQTDARLTSQLPVHDPMLCKHQLSLLFSAKLIHTVPISLLLR